ncbi:hypothetical protein LBMAG51_04130 [Phycisphaerae bacterium]|nr:hypothetical protein LBMAG51_04130 [Phycisphaerae bacterium]
MMSINPNQSESNSNDAPEDRFVDALLTHKFTETTESMDARINRVLRAVESQNNRNYSIRKWQWWALPIAALLAISLLVMPTTSSASAVVRSAAKVANKNVDRQYQVILMPKVRRDGEQPPPILATLDVRDSQHMRIEIHYQGGRTEIRGRDGETSWEQRPDGSAVIADHDLPWPRWVETPDGSLLVDSMAAMLEDLDDSYDIVKVDDAEACGQTGLLQIRASFPMSEPALANTPNEKVRRNPAERIEMCIDPKTNEVIRLEMFFPANDGPRPDGQRTGGERGPPPDGHRGPPPNGERGPRPDGPRPDGPRPDGPRPDGERGPRPDGPRAGGERSPPRGGPLGPPQSISFERTETKSFPSNWFNAPANAVEANPPQ